MFMNLRGLDRVLLGGDNSDLPPRGVYVYKSKRVG